jgi:ribosomal protein S18 acetylase RimI-like enzyme
METEIQVRPASEADLPVLMAFDHGSTSERVWQLDLRREPRDFRVAATFREVRLPRPVSLPYPRDPARLPEVWERKALMYVAATGIQPIGYATAAVPHAEHTWISDLVVVPRWRRRGVGSALLAALQQAAKARGARSLFLEMQTKNYPAIRLAQKHGYDFCGYNDHYYSTQDIALFFVRAL